MSEMFDDLHDPDPPEFSARHFHAVTARARALRRQRYALAAGVCAVVLGIGAGAVVAIGRGGEPSELGPTTDPPTTIPTETTRPSTPECVPPATTPPGAMQPAESLPECPPTDCPTAGTTPTGDGAPPTTECVPLETTPPGTEPIGTAPPETVPPATEPPATASPDTVSPTTILPIGCSGPPPGVLAIEGGDVVRVRSDGGDGDQEIVVGADAVGIGNTIERALQAPDGTIWLQVSGSGVRSIIGSFVEGTFSGVRSGEVELAAVGELGGTSVAAVLDSANPDEAESYGSFELVSRSGEALITVPDPFGLTSSPWTVSINEGVVAVGYIYDLGEGFRFLADDGDEVSRYDPNTSGTPNDGSDDAIPYGTPPLAAAPMQLADGQIAWLEGPDTDLESGRRVGDWQLVIADEATGDEVTRARIGDVGDAYISSETDGRWLVVNYGVYVEAELPEPSRSVIVDLAADEPEAVPVCDGLTNVALTRA